MACSTSTSRLHVCACSVRVAHRRRWNSLRPAIPAKRPDPQEVKSITEGEQYQALEAVRALKTRPDGASLLGLPWRTLTWVVYGRKVASYYREWPIKKRAGGTRQMAAPQSTLYRI